MTVDKLRTSDVERLLEAFLSLETPDEVYAFLVDVATVREIHDLAHFVPAHPDEFAVPLVMLVAVCIAPLRFVLPPA